MARKPRIHYKGALYHVICRGNNRESIFATETDKQDYILQIIRYKERYNFKLYSYCIMDNHAHLVIEIDEAPLAKIMQGIQQVYTQRYNYRYDHVGHVFQQRYKAILIDKQAYLLQLIRYVHNNPVKAGYEDGLNYAWCSHTDYLKSDSSSFVDFNYPLKMFSQYKNKQISKYLKFMNVTNETFEKISENELAPLEYRSLFNTQTKSIYYSPESIVLKIRDVTGVKLSEIREKNRRQKIVDARKLLVYMLSEYTYLTRKEIAEFVNVSVASISVMLNSKERVKELKNKIK
ncbi:transposase [Clostridium sp. 'deep sea']|uniref:transposase n=1 Tax=Clostridium sp. 'deep sea' TaxID=2779445 RepID=UPI0018967993|nr:transposase [Clostridium sp. 'deep sea']QOR33698.1 transposase [Clostridium sp. 'deep sea']